MRTLLWDVMTRLFNSREKCASYQGSTQEALKQLMGMRRVDCALRTKLLSDTWHKFVISLSQIQGALHPAGTKLQAKPTKTARVKYLWVKTWRVSLHS
jgi:hypothetical protein